MLHKIAVFPSVPQLQYRENTAGLPRKGLHAVEIPVGGTVAGGDMILGASPRV